jgi:carbonic anhydrase
VCATGPDHWAEEYQTCAGKFQSPIDIEEHLVTQVRLPPLRFYHFDKEPVASTLTNNGHTGESNTASLGRNETHGVQTPHAEVHEYNKHAYLVL